MSALQTIKSFFDRQIYDLCPYKSEMAADGANRDVATVSFEVPIRDKDGKIVGGNRYRMTVKQAYSHPPLGLIELTDFANGDKVEGPIKDDTWNAVEKRLRGTIAISSMAGVAAEAGMTGVNFAALGLSEVPPFVNPATLPLGLAPIVRYYANPGEHYMEGCALATHVHPDGSLDLTIFPHGGEIYHRTNVRRRSETDIHCVWDFHEGADIVGAMTKRIDELSEQVKALEDRLAKTDWEADKPAFLAREPAAKRGQGRRKVA